MTAAPIEPRSWPRHRWWLLIALVFTAHIGLIFAFGKRDSVGGRQRVLAPAIRMASEQSELLINDPTLFALPHPKGFAAAAWLRIPRYDFPPFRWIEQRETGCPLPDGQLGAAFLRFMQTNVFPRREVEGLPLPQLTTPVVPPLETPLPTRSTLRITGELAKRPLLNPVELRSWPGPDLLNDSVVEVLVDAGGNVFSATLLLPPRRGKNEADQQALEFARAARFAAESPPPIFATNPVGRLTRGALIFQWHTEPAPTTNAPAAKP